MSESHNSGISLEVKVRTELKKYYKYEEIQKKKVSIPGYYTPTGLIKSYEPDHIVPDKIFEDKNDKNKGAPEKLPQAVMKMQLLGEETGKTPYLIYEGENYHHYIHNDPVMKIAIESSPDVIILSFLELQKHLFDTMKPIVREDPIVIDNFL